MDLNKPRKLSGSDLRDALEGLNDQLTAALNNTKYPPYVQTKNEGDVKQPPRQLSRQMDYATLDAQRWLLRHDTWITSFVDEARHGRDYDPAFRRLADEIDNNLIKLADKLRPKISKKLEPKHIIAVLKHNPSM